MSEESTDKTIAKFVFSGKKIDWLILSEKFLARAKCKEYKNILLGRVNVPDDLKTIDTSTDTGKAEAKLRDLNELAYEDLKTIYQWEYRCRENCVQYYTQLKNV